MLGVGNRGYLPINWRSGKAIFVRPPVPVQVRQTVRPCYLAVLQRKPVAMRIDAPFSELPVAFQALQTILLSAPVVIGKWSMYWL